MQKDPNSVVAPATYTWPSHTNINNTRDGSESPPANNVNGNVDRIRKLPTSTQHRLRSSQILTTLPQVVSELLQNALDAGAKTVEIGVDCEEWMCWVKDDGCGIAKEGLKALAGAGGEHEEENKGRYRTSKVYNASMSNSASAFGFRGEALASAADLCCLEIASRTVNSRETWSVILKGGRCLYDGPAIRWKRERYSGTTVCIRDAFHNLPVRRRSHPPPSRTLELTRREVETYALVFPGVTFSLENLQQQRSNQTTAKDKAVLRVTKTPSTLATFRTLYGRALVEHYEEIREVSGDLRLDGFISLIGAHSKSYQFLYINGHPISPCELHHAIDIRFNASSFGKNALDEKGDTNLPRLSVRRSPRKTEKKPIYVLNLSIPPDQVDNCLEPAKSSVYVQKSTKASFFLSSVVQKFLERNRFILSEQKAVQPRVAHIFDSPRKRKRADQDQTSTSTDGLTQLYLNEQAPRKRPFIVNRSKQHGGSEGDAFLWADQNTGETFEIDRRTGHSRIQGLLRPSGDVPSNGLAPSRRTLRSTEPDSHESHRIPEWIQVALKSNQVYSATEKSVRSLCKSLDRSLLLGAGTDRPNGRSFLAKGLYNGDGIPGFGATTHKLRKSDLRSAKVVGQVDRKFIACLITHGDGKSLAHSASSPHTRTSLVVIDQHAADERIRVELFLRELCFGYLQNRDPGGKAEDGIQMREIKPPIPILLTRDEGTRLRRTPLVVEAFRHWGFHFDLAWSDDSPDGQDPFVAERNDDYIQVFVRRVPEMVGEKLLSGDELRDLVKGYITQFATEPPGPGNEGSEYPDSSPGQEGELGWLRALRWCPRGLVALVNSKACRGAIMFNDSLNMDQCERLIAQLSDTALPFQCAHGRPSLIPLVDLTAEQQVFSSKPRCRADLMWSRLEGHDPPGEPI